MPGKHISGANSGMFGGLKRVWMTDVTDTCRSNGWSGKSQISRSNCMIWAELLFNLSLRLKMKSLNFLGLKNQKPKDS